MWVHFCGDNDYNPVLLAAHGKFVPYLIMAREFWALHGQATHVVLPGPSTTRPLVSSWEVGIYND